MRSGAREQTIALLQALIAIPIVIAASEIFIDSSQSQLAVVICLVSLPFSLVLGNELNLLRGCGRYGAYSAIRFGQSAAWALIVCLFYLAHRPSTAGSIVAFVATTIGATVWASAVLLGEVGPPRFSLAGSSRYLRYGALVWLAGMSFQANACLDQVFLGGSVSSAELGQYAVAVSLASVRHYSHRDSGRHTSRHRNSFTNGSDRLWEKRNLILAMSSTTLLALILAIGAPQIVEDPTRARVLACSSASPDLASRTRSRSVGTNNLHEIYRGQGRLLQPALIEGAGAIMTAILLLFAVPRWGSTGAAWVSVAVYWPVLIALISAWRPGRTASGRKEQALGAEDHIAYPDPTS